MGWLALNESPHLNAAMSTQKVDNFNICHGFTNNITSLVKYSSLFIHVLYCDVTTNIKTKFRFNQKPKLEIWGKKNLFIPMSKKNFEIKFYM